MAEITGWCLAGPGQVPDSEVTRLAADLEAAVRRLAAQGVLWFWAGGALGFDTLAELTVMKVREQMPQVHLGLLLPGEDQTAGWHPANTAVYEVIRSRADAVEYAAGQAQAAALAARCAGCIAWCPPGQPEPPLAARARQAGLELLLL